MNDTSIRLKRYMVLTGLLFVVTFMCFAMTPDCNPLPYIDFHHFQGQVAECHKSLPLEINSQVTAVSGSVKNTISSQRTAHGL